MGKRTPGPQPWKEKEMSVYQQHGFKDRRAYLANLADNYGNAVYMMADLLGPN
jgi:hypothetical protein